MATQKQVAATNTALAGVARRLTAAVTELRDSVAGLSGDVGTLQLSGSPDVGPLSSRHASLSAQVEQVAALAAELGGLDAANPPDPADGDKADSTPARQ